MRNIIDRGKPHHLQELIQEVREIFLEAGFDEIENQLFITEDDVYKQYGSEAPVVLDRCYYLAGLPRPDIGLSHEMVGAVKNLDSGIDIAKLKKIFRSYREGLIEGDNLIDEMVQKLDINEKHAVELIELFPAFREIKAEASKVTLRSHMTAAWYPTIEAFKKISEPPWQLFSIGLRFRREQKIDATHLRAHYGASCVLVDKDLSLEESIQLSERMLEQLGFNELEFVKKKATSNYYEKDTEYEIFSGGIEIADCGIYSAESLENYNIRFPVFNLGFGLERILMLRMNVEDIREIRYPQFYGKLDFSDKEIAEGINIKSRPETDSGRELVEGIIKVARRNAKAGSPCEFHVWGGVLGGESLEVYLVEREDDKNLLGPAALNEVYVHEGSVYGIPDDVKKLDNNLVKVKENGIATGITYLEAIANLFAYRIEKKEHEPMQIGMVKSPSYVNIEIDEIIRRYITSNNKKISIKGPVFISIELKKR
ncbi:MAG: O-phosphoserine--tRNA ligase [Candidatus Altiarchaeales archaeon ex4484_2]|nr:MAG: O-phosphoserine--tRNA ligase [Candidatus Altiarchaeales archaeon ex4484_2]